MLKACWNGDKPFKIRKGTKKTRMSMKFSRELTSAFELIRRTSDFIGCFKDKDNTGKPEDLVSVKLS